MKLPNDAGSTTSVLSLSISTRADNEKKLLRSRPPKSPVPGVDVLDIVYVTWKPFDALDLCRQN
jgi:hypothetical protein